MIENIGRSFQGIWSHKMRSVLTMLGIIIGIASIIAIVSTIKGTNEQIKEQLIGSGNNTVKINLMQGDSAYESSYFSSSGHAPVLTSEVKNQVRKVKHVQNATFYYSRSWAQAYYGAKVFDGGKVLGVDEEYLRTCGYVVQLGRAFVEKDYSEYKRVCILDSSAATTMFQGDYAIGKTIEIEGNPFIVIGIVSQNEDYASMINSYSDYWSYAQDSVGTILIPDVDWSVPYKFDDSQNCIIRADSTDNMSSAGKDAAEILNGIMSDNSQFKYQAEDIMEQVRSQQKLAQSTNQQLIWIASISLLVGGIGVMNIMLVSVTERTSEIGLKKAIGARKRTILIEFLTEAAVLTSVGGMIGVAAGIGMSKVISALTGTPSAISVVSIVIAVAFSTLIGVVFGFLPSVQAADLNPIDALRSE